MRLCPKCKSPTLAPYGSARAGGDTDQVPPSRCVRCRGVWLPHEAVAEHLSPEAIDAPAATPSEADRLPGFCPRCRGILERARVDDVTPFHLDRCPACRGIWFDAGEWAAMASTEWLHHLDDLWDPVWRKKVRDERAENRHLETIERALGADAFAKVKAAVDALRDHPMRSLGLSYLVEELRVARRYDPGPSQE